MVLNHVNLTANTIDDNLRPWLHLEPDVFPAVTYLLELGVPINYLLYATKRREL
jgi:hypothetical protein